MSGNGFLLNYFWAYTHYYIPNGPAGPVKVPLPTQERGVNEDSNKNNPVCLLPTTPIPLCVYRIEIKSERGHGWDNLYGCSIAPGLCLPS